jgi:hypothetical protein
MGGLLFEVGLKTLAVDAVPFSLWQEAHLHPNGQGVGPAKGLGRSHRRRQRKNEAPKG